MNKTSSLITGGLTVSAAELVPAVEWILGGCHGPVPASVSSLVAGLVAAGIHAAYNVVAARAAKTQFATATLINPANVVSPAVSVPAGAQQ
ncbi:hypothetical protein PPGU19_012220 [Paraburkholderia sp. PGU19]|uniref:hypothetical protein n=1 Tax=Paraburkholderia sp. PGU19 TaxID=2735434 RepID=UPI0015D9E878|nr:hypothetical protein [Paraburkholderia sp. PGU19]BCF96653.1 hypothetical protein PPGU19_012220 [Paraburkholderia sp. PGU19]